MDNRKLSKIKKLDWFGKPFTFRLPGGNEYIKTWSGAIITIFIILLVIFYSGMNFMKLEDF